MTDREEEDILRDARAQATSSVDQVIAAAMGDADVVVAIVKATEACQEAAKALVGRGLLPEQALGFLTGAIVETLARPK